MSNTKVIVGVPGSGKSLFVKYYMKVFPHTLLIDGQKGISPQVTPIFSEKGNIEEYKQCPELIIDDLFLLLDDIRFRKTILSILEYRIMHYKSLLLTGFAERFMKSQITLIKEIYPTSEIYTMTKYTDSIKCIRCLFLKEYKIDTTRSMGVYLMNAKGCSLEETGERIILAAHEWNMFTKDLLFLRFLEEGNIQCISMDENGDEVYTAWLPLTKGQKYIEDLIKDCNPSSSANIKINTILSWKEIDKKKVYIAIDLYKRNK